MTIDHFQSFFFLFTCVALAKACLVMGPLGPFVCLAATLLRYQKKVVFKVTRAVSACFCHVIVSQRKLSAQKHNTGNSNLSVHAF